MIKILIVDDQNFTREALEAILEAEVDFEIVGKAENGIQAFEYMERVNTDIVIVDLEMPEMNGLTLTKMVRQRFPDTKVIILSSHSDEQNINSAVLSGARGYLLKNTSAQEIVDTIRAIQRGYFQLGPGLFEKLLSHLISEKEQAANNLSQLERKYSESIAQLEAKIALKNEKERRELKNEIESQVSELKLEFRDGLVAFQDRVSNQLQEGLDVAAIHLNNSIPNIQNIERQIDTRNLEQQRYINTLLSSSKQSIKKLETQVGFIRNFLIFLSIIVFIDKLTILLLK